MTEVTTLEQAAALFNKKPKESIKCRCKSAALICRNLEQAEAFFADLNGPASKDNVIRQFMHCRNCIENLPKGISPRDWAEIECGWTPHGFQVWCKRCEKNIMHIDLKGQKVDVIQ